MDADFWRMRLATAKRQLTLQNNQLSRLDRFNVDDFDGEEESRLDYPCPCCCEEFDLVSLCSHLEAEHPYESNSTVSPVCSVKVAGDMINHLILQHGHLFKFQHRGRLRRSPFPNSQALSLLGRDLREAHLQVLLGGSGFRSNREASSTAATDNLLSSLVLNFPTSENDDISKSLMSSLEENSNMSPQNMWNSSFHSSLSREEREQRMKQASGRAVFVQDLLASTLLAEN